MHYLKLALAGLLAFAFSSDAAYSLGRVKAAGLFQGSNLDNGDYHFGTGVSGSLGQETPVYDGIYAGGFGLRANYTHYAIEGDERGPDLNEGGVVMTGLFGPTQGKINPRVGGHAGYARLESGNFFDWGADITADFGFSPQLGIQAMATPYWYTNDNRTDYRGTKLGLGLVWTMPRGV
jgi:hypothetical protein